MQYYERSLTLEEAMRGHVLLVYGMNGEALPPAHGAPVRLIVPGWYGCASGEYMLGRAGRGEGLTEKQSSG